MRGHDAFVVVCPACEMTEVVEGDPDRGSESGLHIVPDPYATAKDVATAHRQSTGHQMVVRPIGGTTWLPADHDLLNRDHHRIDLPDDRAYVVDCSECLFERTIEATETDAFSPYPVWSDAYERALRHAERTGHPVTLGPASDRTPETTYTIAADATWGDGTPTGAYEWTDRGVDRADDHPVDGVRKLEAERISVGPGFPVPDGHETRRSFGMSPTAAAVLVWVLSVILVAVLALLTAWAIA